MEEVDMEMETEMDIPLPEELEWLESSVLLQEEDEQEQHYPYDEEASEQPLPEKISEIPDLTTGIRNSYERLEHDERCSHAPAPDSTKALNQGRKRKSPENEADVDWLHYSPPPNDSNSDPVICVGSSEAVAPEAVQEKLISRFASEIDGECVSVTDPTGDRAYAKMDRLGVKDGAKGLRMERPFNGLLSEPINVLMERVEQDAFTKALKESSESVNDNIHQNVPIANEQLWVDKYAPNSFTELLSDEQTNREVLLWLKQWDSCVFGSQIRATTDDVLSALRRHSTLAQHQKHSDGRKFFNKNRTTGPGNHFLKQADDFNPSDTNLQGVSEFGNKMSLVTNPPEQKVLLLCGPPGLGKTTLAHVAAKHCGYRVVEINASDDRSLATIESKILDVVQMNSVMADGKPKCLVIDEIDGALGEGKGAVEAIIKLVSNDKKSYLGKENSTEEARLGKFSSKKRPKSSTLSRPVICICNDLFAPALRPLRQVAKVYTFVQPTVSRVVNRLKYICNKEGFKASAVALTALAEFTECDIRSCLNTLQFLNKKKDVLNMLEVGSQVIGRKDTSKSAFDVWKEIFHKKKAKREKKSMSGSSSGSKGFDFLYSLITSFGNSELTMDGIHENYLQIHYHDPIMQKTVKCLDNISVSDSLVQYTMRTHQMFFNVYHPSTVIAIHSLIAQVEKPNIEWPKSFQRYRVMLMEKKDCLKLWHNKILPSISRHLSIESFVEDSVSPILHILSPPTLRPVALHLLSESEKDGLAHLVDTMVSYSISYKNIKPELQSNVQRYAKDSDSQVLSFDPPIGDFVNFKGYHSGHLELSLAMKQVLVHEVEKQRILQKSNGRSRNINDAGNSYCQPITQEQKKGVFPSISEGMAAHVQNSSIKLNSSAGLNHKLEHGFKSSALPGGLKLKSPENAKKASCRSTSFFDRFRKSGAANAQNDVDSLEKTATSERDSRPFLFKFNEGFTNAVKRPVRMRELLL